MNRLLRAGRLVRRLFSEELSYNLSRKYPYGSEKYKWGWLFKPAVFGFSLVLLALISTFSYATNGFDKDFMYTTDPNSTESKREWYHRTIFTWGSDNMNPKCQNTDIPVGHEFLTTNLGLRYTVKRILYFPPNSKGPWEAQQKSSVSYHNNTLFNCETNVISIYLRKADESRPGKGDEMNLWWSWMDSTADAVARCDMINEEGYYTLEFLVKYSTLVEDYSYLAVENETTHASFWWGARLLNAYFVGTQYVMAGKLPDNNEDTPIYTRATLAYRHLPNQTTSMKDPELFSNWYYFLVSTGGIANGGMGDKDADADTQPLYNNPKNNQSRPHTEGLMWAKIFRSLILTDLGNSEAPNLLLDEELLQYALNPGTDDFNRVDGAPLAVSHETQKRKRDWHKFGGIPPPHQLLTEETAVPLQEAYEAFKGKTGKLGTRPASINVEYICSVPGKRTLLASIIFTLVATLAIFQAFWALFKYFIDLSVTWNHPERNWCEHCDVEYAQDLELQQANESSGRFGRTSQYSEVSSTRGLLQDESLEA